LIDLGHLFLAASAIAAIPVASEVYNVTRGEKSEIETVRQWLGGVVVMASLAGLIWVQLALSKPPAGRDAIQASGVRQPTVPAVPAAANGRRSQGLDHARMKFDGKVRL